MRRIITLLALLFLSTRLSARGQVGVTNTNDSGPGSLRQAILDLPACPKPCHIAFFIAGTPQKGYWTIEPLTPLPTIYAGSVHIDGHTQTNYGGDTNPNGPEIVLSGAQLGMTQGLRFERIGSGPLPHGDHTIRGLGFERFQGAALALWGTLGIGLRPHRLSQVTIVDNYFGVDAHGQSSAPNRMAIQMGLVDDAVIANNVISGNELGITVAGASRIRIARNNIGMDAGGANVLGNATVGIRFSGVDDSIVERNLIAGHLAGVTIEGTVSSRGNTIHRNQMFENGIGVDLQNDGPTLNDSADLDSGPNELQNYPTLRTSGKTLRGELDSTPLSDFDVDIFATDTLASNEGSRYIGTVTVRTDSKGRASFSFILPYGSGPYYTATATSDVRRSTSEFCQPVS